MARSRGGGGNNLGGLLVLIALPFIFVGWLLINYWEELLGLAFIVWVVYLIVKGNEKATIERPAKIRQKFEDRKNELKQHVTFSLPKGLNKFEEEVKIARTLLSKNETKSFPVPLAPYWQEISFTPFELPKRVGGSRKIEIKDIAAILVPNEHTWSDRESELIGDGCKYSSSFPSKDNDFPPDFDEIDLITGIPDEALFKYDKSYVSTSSVETYFAEEDAAAKNHNHILAELKVQAEELNSRILAYNERVAKEKLRYRFFYTSTYDEEKEKYKKVSEAYISACKAQKNDFANMLKGYGDKNAEAVIRRLDYILQSIKLPNSIPYKWKVDFDPIESIAIVEIRLPDVVHSEIYKTVQLKSGAVLKPLNQKEFRDAAPNIHPALLLRAAYEVFRNDIQNVIDLLVINGWVEFDDPSTGNTTKTYTASLAVTKDKILSLNLQKLDPLAAFMALKGKTAGKLIDIIPVTPILSLDRKDKRFISTKEVLNKLGSETNLAAMDWQDFESLIAELFEKEFAKEGAEVKVTQASRDRGVDAIVFDPDPIKGGKFIIQAKRYTNTVDVSAVRDLCAVVKKEGALKGLLVTTSTYGSDAYAFAQNEPITLLNGAELLGMLEKHGYKFRINLAEARNIMKST